MQRFNKYIVIEILLEIITSFIAFFFFSIFANRLLNAKIFYFRLLKIWLEKIR